jgi:hypothetical protein
MSELAHGRSMQMTSVAPVETAHGPQTHAPSSRQRPVRSQARLEPHLSGMNTVSRSSALAGTKMPPNSPACVWKGSGTRRQRTQPERRAAPLRRVQPIVEAGLSPGPHHNAVAVRWVTRAGLPDDTAHIDDDRPVWDTTTLEIAEPRRRPGDPHVRRTNHRDDPTFASATRARSASGDHSQPI